MIKSYITYLESLSRSPSTISGYTKNIEDMLNYIGKDEKGIVAEDIMKWQLTFKDKSRNTQNRYMYAVKDYFKYLCDFGYIEKNPAEKIKVKRVRECDVKQKPYIEAHYLRDMVNAAQNLRDRAIVLLFASTGIRVGELINITLDDYNNMTGEDNRELKIVGKGDKTRYVYINDEVKLAIDMYLNTRPNVECDRLFLSHWNNPICRNNLSNTLKLIAKNAGVPFWKDICNHCLRAAFATTKAEQNVPLTVIQNSMGHARLETTLIYIKNNQANINKAMKEMAF